MQPRIISQCLSWLGFPSRSPRHLRLRTKLLFSLVLIIAGLTCATLLTIRQAAEAQVQKEFEKDAQNSVLAFQNLRAERQIELEREAELLATLPSVKAMMADPAAANIQEASEEVWESRGNELFALADWTGKILALHTFTPGFSESRTPSHEDSAFLQKPFSRQTLLRSVREVLGNEAVASPQSIPVP
jgi:cell division protein FtsI/penicillin-binding protein 2